MAICGKAGADHGLAPGGTAAFGRCHRSGEIAQGPFGRLILEYMAGAGGERGRELAANGSAVPGHKGFAAGMIMRGTKRFGPGGGGLRGGEVDQRRRRHLIQVMPAEDAWPGTQPRGIEIGAQYLGGVGAR